MAMSSYLKQYLDQALPTTTITARYLADVLGMKRSEVCRLWLAGRNTPHEEYSTLLAEKLSIPQEEIVMASMIDKIPETYREPVWSLFKELI